VNGPFSGGSVVFPVLKARASFKIEIFGVNFPILGVISRFLCQNVEESLIKEARVYIVGLYLQW
jgi:hypothetical protein